jgi:hypothetical protein
VRTFPAFETSPQHLKKRREDLRPQRHAFFDKLGYCTGSMTDFCGFYD